MTLRPAKSAKLRRQMSLSFPSRKSAHALKRSIEERFGHVRVRGEISGYKGPHSSGHCYFSIKDEGAKLDAVIWRGSFSRLRAKLQEGLEVIVTGKITSYPGKSSYQIIIEAVEPAGVGALMALLEERRKKLAAEGLFDASRKKPLALSAADHWRHHLADGRRDP
jgi:exodeoxyribonuclease VII large subunit